MSEEIYDIDDYISINSDSESGDINIDITVTKSNDITTTPLPLTQNINISDEDIAYLKAFNTSKFNSGQEKKSASSVGSTRTIDSAKRPSENFLGNFFENNNNNNNSSNNILHMPNKSPPRPHSPGQHMTFINMTSFNLQQHNNKNLSHSTFDLYSKKNGSEEIMVSQNSTNLISQTNTPRLIPEEKGIQTSKDTLVLSYENRNNNNNNNNIIINNDDNNNNTISALEEDEFMGFHPPTRASTGTTTTTTDRSDIVMSHQSQPSTVTAGTNNEEKDQVNMIYSPAANSQNASESPKDLTGKFSSTNFTEEHEEEEEEDQKQSTNTKINNKTILERQRQMAIGLAQSLMPPSIKDKDDPLYASSNFNNNKSRSNFNNSANNHVPQQQRYMFQNSSPDLINNTTLVANQHIQNNKSHSISGPGTGSPVLQYHQMTPSQKLRYRREQSKNKVKSTAHFKEYVYDKLENIEKTYYQHGNIYTQPPAINTSASMSSSGSSISSASSGVKTTTTTNNLPRTKMTLEESPIIWNVPMTATAAAINTSYSTKNSSIPKSQHSQRQNSKTSSISATSMPMTSLYGVSDRKDLIDSFNQTSISLSELYLHEQSRQNTNKINQRKQETEFLPETLKEATREGLEDATFVSKEKLNSLSSSRPSWLPVKDSKENEKHEREIYRTVSNASIDKLQLNRKFENLPDVVSEMKVKLDKLFNVDCEEKDQIVNSSSILSGINKIMWEYPCLTSIDNRYNTYHRVLLSDIYSSGLFPSKIELQNFPGLDYNLKEEDNIKKLIIKNMSQYDDEASMENRLHSSRKITQILYQLVHQRSILNENCNEINISCILYDMLLRSYGLMDIELSQLQNYENRTEIEYVIRKIWDLEQLISKICFNEVVIEKYNDRIMNKKGLLAQSLKMEYGFDSEMTSENLNFNNFLQILNKLPNKLCLWVLDIIVLNNAVLMNKNSLQYYLDKISDKFESSSNKKVDAYDYWMKKYSTNNYKTLISLTISVLLNYHFGYSDFQELSEISLNNYNLLGLTNKPIIELLTSSKPFSRKRLSRVTRKATSLSISRSSSGFFLDPKRSSIISTSKRSSQLNTTVSNDDVESETQISEATTNGGADVALENTLISIESLDFMNISSLDLMGIRNFSCQEEDEDDYTSMEGFMKKWNLYYKKL
ncbi:hypothetical protein HANVADRAFT_52943 [Hanseniaspora valbyensis NRRL Y-1626]|uniref:Protein SBE22 n=1 Tax=Hanseniaspora valbyensis NRRL Y-1626 TaxID=766949 RepID=A0A1B7TD41_9ASCO|nr:hypothetical protein HANVADRAFT_52943 [Hanseniaspora valbyensis NRRL Y-1626]